MYAMELKRCFLTVIFVITLISIVSGRSSYGSSINDLIIIKVCNQTSPVPLRILNEVLINKKLSPSNVKELECFFHCLYTKYEWMDTQGGFMLTAIKDSLQDTQLSTEEIDTLVYKCTALTLSDPCRRAMLFTQCFWTHQEHIKEDKNSLL